jgi:hypothetical protein
MHERVCRIGVYSNPRSAPEYLGLCIATRFRFQFRRDEARRERTTDRDQRTKGRYPASQPTLEPPATHYPIFCILPDGDPAFSINIPETRTVGELNDTTKLELARLLAGTRMRPSQPEDYLILRVT